MPPKPPSSWWDFGFGLGSIHLGLGIVPHGPDDSQTTQAALLLVGVPCRSFSFFSNVGPVEPRQHRRTHMPNGWRQGSVVERQRCHLFGQEFHGWCPGRWWWWHRRYQGEGRLMGHICCKRRLGPCGGVGPIGRGFQLWATLVGLVEGFYSSSLKLRWAIGVWSRPLGLKRIELKQRWKGPWWPWEAHKRKLSPRFLYSILEKMGA